MQLTVWTQANLTIYDSAFSFDWNSKLLMYYNYWTLTYLSASLSGHIQGSDLQRLHIFKGGDMAAQSVYMCVSSWISI